MPQQAAQFAIVGVIIGWFVLGAVLLKARLQQSGAGKAQKRDLASWFGLALQGLGFAVAWGWRDGRYPTLMSLLPAAGQWPLALFAIALALASALFAAAAVRELGKQWSLTARLLQGHELITSGPFARVRHPIYSALLGMLAATGVILVSPQATLVAIAIYLFGTHLRARREERLLAEMFGEAYADYARRVPRLLPRLRRER